jgi:hypothetical protein
MLAKACPKKRLKLNWGTPSTPSLRVTSELSLRSDQIMLPDDRWRELALGRGGAKQDANAGEARNALWRFGADLLGLLDGLNFGECVCHFIDALNEVSDSRVLNFQLQ